MKKTLMILALTLTNSMAAIDAPSTITNSEHIKVEMNPEIITREIRPSRQIRENREVPQARSITIEEAPSPRLARVSREVREDRFIVHSIRENRKVRYVVLQNNLHIAGLK